MKVSDSSGYDSIEGRRTYRREFTPFADAKSLTVELIVSRPLSFEFKVDPAAVQPSASPTPIR